MAAPRRKANGHNRFPNTPPRRIRRWASRKGTADHLGCSLRTVTQMVSDGRIIAYRLGGTVRFDLDEIDAAFEPSGGALR